MVQASICLVFCLGVLGGDTGAGKKDVWHNFSCWFLFGMGLDFLYMGLLKLIPS